MEPDVTTSAPAVIQALVDNHRRFLAFLERRVRSREVAEDLLQEAFVRGLHHAPALRDDEAAVAWFYRVLRNALVDHYRHQGVEQRRLAPEAAADIVADPATVDPELYAEICRCVSALLPTLKPEYAAAIQRIDVDGASHGTFAAEAGITANNAGVRVHRARQALARQLQQSCGTCADHGCLDCHCGAPARHGVDRPAPRAW